MMTAASGVHSRALSTHSRVPACRQVQSSHQHAASERSISTFMKLFLSLLKIHDGQEEINHTALKSVYRLLREKNQLGSDLVCLIELLISWCANVCVCVRVCFQILHVFVNVYLQLYCAWTVCVSIHASKLALCMWVCVVDVKWQILIKYASD